MRNQQIYEYDSEYCHKKLYEFIQQSPYKFEGTAMDYNGKTISTDQFDAMVKKASIAYKNMGVQNNEKVCMFALNTPEMIASFYALNNIGAISEWFNPKVMNPTLLNNFLVKHKIRFLVVNNIVYDMVRVSLKNTCVEKIIVNTLTDSAHCLYSFGFNSALNLIKNISELGIVKNSNANLAVKIKDTREKIYADKLISYKKDKKSGKLDARFISYYDFINKYYKDEEITYSEYEKEKVSLIVHSSGTTGAYKRIAMCDYQVNASAYNTTIVPNAYSEGDTCLFLIPMFVATAMFQLHTERYLYFKSYVKPLYQEDKFVSHIIKHKPNHMIVVPAFLKKIVEDKRLENFDFSFLKSIHFGGSGINKDLYKSIQERLDKNGSREFAQIVYGQSEFMGAMTVNFGGELKIKGRHYESAGELIPNGSKVKIVDTDMNDITSNKDANGNFIEGDIYFTGPTMFKGYYNENDETINPFVIFNDGKYYSKTGDEGYYDPEKGLIISGRTSVVRQKGGCKVNLTELKLMLEKNSEIDEAIVVAIPDEEFDYKAVAYIVLKLNSEEMRRLVVTKADDVLKNNYTENYYIKSYVFCDGFVKTAFGKSDIGFVEKDVKNLYSLCGEDMNKVILRNFATQ